MADIWALIETDKEEYGHAKKTVLTCLPLSRGFLFKDSKVLKPEIFINALQTAVEETYALGKSGQWKQLLNHWINSPILANCCSRYEHPSSKWTFLHQAAYFGHQEACRALIAKGAFVDALTRDGRTPADVAAEKGHLETEHLLRRASLEHVSP